MYCNTAEMFSVTQDFKVCLDRSTDLAKAKGQGRTCTSNYSQAHFLPNRIIPMSITLKSKRTEINANLFRGIS